MTTVGFNFDFFFRLPDYQHIADIDSLLEDEFEEKTSENKENILCRQCRQVITDVGKHIAVDGAHRHTFANPAGNVYEIGCFFSARGCAYIGIPTEEFTWFKGFSWRVAVCRTCLTHLGWLFIGSAHNTFNGLILERLIFPDTIISS